MKILTFRKFNEAGGVELLNPGINGSSLPNFPSIKSGSPMQALNGITPKLIEGNDGRIYTLDEYNELYLDYGNNEPELRNPLKVNLDTLLKRKSENNSSIS